MCRLIAFLDSWLHRFPLPLAAVGGAWLLIGLAGCSTVDFPTPLTGKSSGGQKEREASDKKPAEEKIRWDGAGIILGQTDTLGLPVDAFVEIVTEAVAHQRTPQVHRMVDRFPDVAIQAIQEPDLASPEALQAIAAAFEQRWCDGPIWSEYVDAFATDPATLGEGRRKFWELLRDNQPREALRLKWLSGLPRDAGVALRAEAGRLEAIALMMDNDFPTAIQRLTTAMDLVKVACPYHAHQLQLLLGECYRLDKQLDAWKESWQAAVNGQSSLVASHGLRDPGFWTRAAYLRPAGLEWPPEAAENLRDSAARELGPELVELLENGDTTVWLVVGLQHLERDEGQNAILALKKAEAGTSHSRLIDIFHFYQARGMVAAGQSGAASAILIRLISSREGTSMADRSKAVLGALKLQNGAIRQGYNLLESALRTSDQWPAQERLRAVADFGLALLVMGKETEGLERLTEAQQEFELIGDEAEAEQCLWNRAQYFARTDQPEKQQQVLAELDQFSRMR